MAATLPNQLDEAINYIKAMQETLQRMKKRKKQLMWCAGIGKDEENTCLRVPKMEVQDFNSGLRVIAISSTCDHRLKFSEAVRIVEAEGNEIITASYAVVGDVAFYTIESMVASILLLLLPAVVILVSCSSLTSVPFTYRQLAIELEKPTRC